MIFHPERISKLKAFEEHYNFIHITPTEFETNNSNISLRIFDEDSKKIYHSKNDTEAPLVQLKNNTYDALKPLKNKFMRLNKMLKSFSYKQLKEYILSHINSNDSNTLNK